MALFDGIIIATDIDNTFLYQGKYYANVPAIRHFTANGGRFLFASGRNHKDIYNVIPDLAELTNAPNVLCNGGLCYDAQTKEILNPKYLDNSQLPRLCDRLEELAHGRIDDRVYTGRLVYELFDKEFAEYLKENDLQEYAVGLDMSDHDENGRFKLVIYSGKNTVKYLRPIIENEFPMFEYTRSAEHCFELSALGVSKWTQLDYVRSLVRRECPTAEVYAVGDFDNDMDMLIHADRAFCPENAAQCVKDVCERVLCHAEKGVIADLIKFIENERRN